MRWYDLEKPAARSRLEPRHSAMAQRIKIAVSPESGKASQGSRLRSAAAKLPPVPKIHRYDFLTEWWIPKGESILFVVPKERLAMNVMLSVSLRYEWEDLGPEVLDGPVHLVYFRGIDLPDDVQLKINSKFWKDWTAPKP